MEMVVHHHQNMKIRLPVSLTDHHHLPQVSVPYLLNLQAKDRRLIATAIADRIMDLTTVPHLTAMTLLADTAFLLVAPGVAHLAAAVTMEAPAEDREAVGVDEVEDAVEVVVLATLLKPGVVMLATSI